MTIRFGPASPARNGKLELVLSTNAIRPAIGLSSAPHSSTVRSGPIRLNLAAAASPLPWPINITNTRSSALVSFASRPNTLRTFSAVPLSSPAFGCSARTLSAGPSILKLRLQQRGQRVDPAAMQRRVLRVARRALHDDGVARAFRRNAGIATASRTRSSDGDENESSHHVSSAPGWRAECPARARRSAPAAAQAARAAAPRPSGRA